MKSSFPFGLLAVGLVTISAGVGCQLLLPSEDDGDTTSGRGGAEASSSSGTTGKTSSAKASTSDASASVSTTGHGSSTDAASSSSGATCEQGLGCADMPPTFDVCEASDVCTVTGGDDWCNDY